MMFCRQRLCLFCLTVGRLQGKRVMSLDMGLLLAGAKERGELETRVTSLIEETRSAGVIWDLLLGFTVTAAHVGFVLEIMFTLLDQDSEKHNL